MTIISRYQNGNCEVALYADGTKTREYEGEPRPQFPESVDLKITDWCDGKCAWCHERSTVNGKHADIDNVLRIVNDLPRGVEIAIGGGDPFSHPELPRILSELSSRGLISNITVNGKHLHRHREAIQKYRARHWIYGLGITYAEEEEWNIEEIADENTVIHFIAGVHFVLDARSWARDRKILVLGYKDYGRGAEHLNDAVLKNHRSWRYWIGPIIRNSHLVSFDNLALKQLRIQEQVKPEVWESKYMGDDGQFTMYVDAVNMEYAVSSTSPRIPLEEMSVAEAFYYVRECCSA